MLWCSDEAAAGRPDLLKDNPRHLDIGRLAEILDEGSAPPVKGLMVWAANPAMTQIDGPRVQRGLMRADLFTVVIDHFMTDTARHADIVLPATTQFEHFDVQGAWGHHYVLANVPAIAPMGEARSSGAIMRGLAAHLGLDDDAFKESDEAIAAATLADGWTLDDLVSAGWRKAPRPRPGSGSLEKRLRLTGEPIAAPAMPGPGLLQLLTPKSHYFLNSTFANMPRQQAAQGAPAITMNRHDADRRSLADGGRVIVRCGETRIEAALALSEGIRSGVVAMEGKWWDMGGADAAPMNRLTTSNWSPAGQPAYNETYVTVEPAP